MPCSKDKLIASDNGVLVKGFWAASRVRQGGVQGRCVSVTSPGILAVGHGIMEPVRFQQGVVDVAFWYGTSVGGTHGESYYQLIKPHIQIKLKTKNY